MSFTFIWLAVETQSNQTAEGKVSWYIFMNVIWNSFQCLKSEFR